MGSAWQYKGRFWAPFVAVPTVTDSAVASLGAFQVLSELTERVEVGVPLCGNSTTAPYFVPWVHNCTLLYTAYQWRLRA